MTILEHPLDLYSKSIRKVCVMGDFNSNSIGQIER